MKADGSMRMVRGGGNGFTCMADNPESPGPDPMCMDSNAVDWVMAWVAHRPPATDKVGFIYMLAGGTDASNVDPYSQRPVGRRPLGQHRPPCHGRRRAVIARQLSFGTVAGHEPALRDVGGERPMRI
jgi:hypothetical protein